ncbi:hypothetical protein MHU86_15031 [Fragilaria crotonensis]|nr:hypothetical protein MHU86_15031 [Fragilaria crotonensis]
MKSPSVSPPPSSYKASVSDPDTLSFAEAMADRDNIEKWLKAANDEIQSLQKNGTWIEVPITEAKTRILPGTWVFRRKRTPDGTISKYKARYCVLPIATKTTSTSSSPTGSERFNFTREGTFTDFLGINFTRDATNGTLTLTQKGLIQKIKEATGMSDSNYNWTPAAQAALGIDPDGPPMTETWSYRSIVGMLLYLSTNTRPDIAFAVSQVARFCHSPKRSHASAVKTLVRYLHRTSDMGMIVKPTGTLNLDCYVDADFAGLHGRDPDRSPTSAKSRTGYIITLGGCPILWKSHLQSEISLSTLEAEYSALSSAMRTLLPSVPCSRKSPPASNFLARSRRRSSVKSSKTTMAPSSRRKPTHHQPHEVLPGEVALLLAARA